MGWWNQGRRRLVGGGLAVGAAAWLGLKTDGFARDAIGGGRREMSAGPAVAPSRQLSLLAGARMISPSTGPLTVEGLLGRIVLVNFWTYSCINSLRPLPYLRAWADKYRDRRLIVLGVHTPEFGFEKDIGNVRRAVESLGVGYPVVLDNDYALWRAFSNRGWPGFHFIGANGSVHSRVIGEGNYDQSERLIQRLLATVDGVEDDGTLAVVRGEGVEAAADWRNLASPETYVGYAKAANFSSPGGARRDVSRVYELPQALGRNQWGLAGAWTIAGEYAKLDAPAGRISHRFRARDLHLVLGAPAPGRPAEIRVTIDGEPPGEAHGSDIDARGWGVVREDRLYQLVRQVGEIRDRTLEINFSEPGLRAYSFTFG